MNPLQSLTSSDIANLIEVASYISGPENWYFSDSGCSSIGLLGISDSAMVTLEKIAAITPSEGV